MAECDAGFVSVICACEEDAICRYHIIRADTDVLLRLHKEVVGLVEMPLQACTLRNPRSCSHGSS